ncbi:thioredoxin [Ferrithrix thermotolerans DSM 19514]|uniref:Thioredoxin n=2 Tax=Ferrithrix TaxID=643949 RepID=A0A1M4UVN3_9ACTN|nr:thioredoxin [Ferrithrix thermotolerans DSM 19514]
MIAIFLYMVAVDVTDATFQQEVVERSKEVPVVIDLWAPWCGPCRTLGPIIEKVVADTRGKVALCKVNVDENPGISQAFRVQSIPAVFAVKDGQVVDTFIGALPEHQVKEFVSKLAPVVSEAEELLDNGDEESLRKAHELEPDSDKVAARLGEFLFTTGRDEEAEALLAKYPETQEIMRVKSMIRLGLPELSKPAVDVIAELNELLESVKKDEAARQRFVDILNAYPFDEETVARYRRLLTSRLF